MQRCRSIVAVLLQLGQAPLSSRHLPDAHSVQQAACHQLPKPGEVRRNKARTDLLDAARRLLRHEGTNQAVEAYPRPHPSGAAEPIGGAALVHQALRRKYGCLHLLGVLSPLMLQLLCQKRRLGGQLAAQGVMQRRLSRSVFKLPQQPVQRGLAGPDRGVCRQLLQSTPQGQGSGTQTRLARFLLHELGSQLLQGLAPELCSELGP
mmetsp:Transcript_98111/g.233510  ORF Transcript_98111/g.233510 Transcript_98111/m.233510 type:complete len:206 (+) Transcript_98111:2269-2886(+)